jgi:hypothetical protein
MATTRVLSPRELNRATLDRQMLLRRAGMSAADALEFLVGLQTQVPHNHYTALWTRLDGFDAEDFSLRFERREFVRISLQRSTIHTVTARDCLWLRPLLQAPQDRTLQAAFGKRLVGVDRLRESFDRLREGLVVFEDENGVELFDLPDAPRPPADVPAPPRFLPEFDNVFIGHRDRSRIISEMDAYRSTWKGNTTQPVFLLDGFIQGTWRLVTDVKQATATLVVRPFSAPRRGERDGIEAEGAALLAFHAPGARHAIEWESHEGGTV